MVCPDCGSITIGKEVTRRGWSGDYICHQCGYNNAKNVFINDGKSGGESVHMEVKKEGLQHLIWLHINV